jgi:hypothetical protein
MHNKGNINEKNEISWRLNKYMGGCIREKSHLEIEIILKEKEERYK